MHLNSFLVILPDFSRALSLCLSLFLAFCFNFAVVAGISFYFILFSICSWTFMPFYFDVVDEKYSHATDLWLLLLSPFHISFVNVTDKNNYSFWSWCHINQHAPNTPPQKNVLINNITHNLQSIKVVSTAMLCVPWLICVFFFPRNRNETQYIRVTGWAGRCECVTSW